jgi:hypothetical protein
MASNMDNDVADDDMASCMDDDVTAYMDADVAAY